MKKIKNCLYLACLFLYSHNLYANQDNFKQSINNLLVDMPASTVPASLLVGGSGEEIPRLSTFQELSVQLSKAFGADGKLKDSVAFDIAPFLAAETFTWNDIEINPYARILSRTTLSFATTISDENNKSAIGLQSILYAPNIDNAITGADKCVKDAVRAGRSSEQCQTDVDNLLSQWNQSLIAIGGGYVFNEKNDTTGVKKQDTGSVWLTYNIGMMFDKDVTSKYGALFTLHNRYTFNYQTQEEESINKVDANLYGINLRVGKPNFAAIAEYSQQNFYSSKSSYDDENKLVLGMEYKPKEGFLAKNGIYLNLGYTRELSGQNNEGVAMKILYGVGKNPALIQ